MKDYGKEDAFKVATKDLWALRDTFQWLCPDEAKAALSEYAERYSMAVDENTDAMQEKDIFAAFMAPESKGDVVNSYRKHIRSCVITHYISQYTRDELKTMITLLAHGVCNQYQAMQIRIVDGAEVSLEELVSEWNRSHPEEEMIYFQVSEIG